MPRGVPLTRGQKMIHYCAAMAGMTFEDLAAVLTELIDEVRRKGTLPSPHPGSFETNRIWAPRFRCFPHLLRADIARSNAALSLWKSEGLSDGITLPDD